MTTHVIESYCPTKTIRAHQRAGLLFVGRRSPEKGLDIARGAAELVRVPLTVLTGQPHSIVQHHLAHAFAILVPSRYDQSPKVVKEAHLQRCLVIATPATGIRDGRTGLCADGTVEGFAAAILRAYQMPTTARLHLLDLAYQRAARRQAIALRAELDLVTQ